jgi:hypothetical protein
MTLTLYRLKKSKLLCQSHLMTDGLSASLSWCKAPSGAKEQIFVTVRQPRVCWSVASALTRDGCVVYNCCWSSPAQPFSGSSRAGLMTVFYCFRFFRLPKPRSRELRIYIPHDHINPVTSLFEIITLNLKFIYTQATALQLRNIVHLLSVCKCIKDNTIIALK